MKTYTYTVSTNTIWTSFDHGQVEAENYEEALEKAEEELRYNFEKVNKALEHCDVTQGFSIHFASSEIQITRR